MASSGKVIDEDRISLISEASKAVADIPKNHLSETKSFGSPPKAVIDVLEAVMILLGYKEANSDWKSIQKALARPTFLKDIGDVDFEKIPQVNRDMALNKVSAYSHESVMKTSLAAAIFYDWIIAVAKD